MKASKHDVIEEQSWVQDTNLINKVVFVSSELCNGGILFSFHNSVPQRYLPKMQHELDQLQLTFTNAETRNQGSLNWYLKLTWFSTFFGVAYSAATNTKSWRSRHKQFVKHFFSFSFQNCNLMLQLSKEQQAYLLRIPREQWLKVCCDI